MDLTVPAAVAALESAFPGMLEEGPAGFGAFESGARSVAPANCAETMSRALEAATASRPTGDLGTRPLYAASPALKYLRQYPNILANLSTIGEDTPEMARIL